MKDKKIKTSKQGAKRGKGISGNAVLCQCNDVTYKTVRSQLRLFPEWSYEEMKKHCGVAQGCGRCELEFHLCYDEVKEAKNKVGKWKVVLNRSIRNFHLFSSLAAAMFLLFFALSGYAMNHRSDLGLDEVEVVSIQKTIPQNLLKSQAKVELLHWLQGEGARGDLLEYEREGEMIYVNYKSAAQSFEAEIERASGNTVISIQKAGFLETLAEMHRSPSPDDKSSSLFIDVMAALMALVSLSGILLFFRIATRKDKWMLIYFAVCISIAVGLYFKMA